MSFDISTLTSAESLWDLVSVWLSIAVAIGVSMEAVTEFDILAGWLRLDTQERFALRHGIAKAGLLILIVALAFEVVAAIETHSINAKIIDGLNGEIESTQKREQDLIDETKALRGDNEKLQSSLSMHEGTLKSLSGRSDEFEKNANALRMRTDASLARLKRDEENLEKAQNDAAGSAGKAANAAQMADKALADMNTALTDVQGMRQRLQEIITPRKIDDEHFAALTTALKPFPETVVEVGVTRDNESIDLLIRITDALTEAKWTIKPWSGGGIGLKSSARPALPDIGDVTARGIQIGLLVTDREKLGPALVALTNGLVSSGMQPTLEALPEQMKDGKPDPLGIKAGVARIIIGAK